ncbi:MAG: 50S ribosomal protein L10 [Candidatus Omnitrophica bacterium]|nr:50S ribosomal protein L10 [Candidatus Omnitrophota bacterium]
MKKWTKGRKKEIVEYLTKEIKNSKIKILGNFSKLKVAEMQKIREGVKQQGGNLMVLKNNLIEIIFKNLSKDEAISEFINGPTFIVWSKKENEIEIIKTLLEFEKSIGKVEIKGGILDNEIIGKDKIQELGKLPGKKELQAQIISLIRSPHIRLANSIKSPIIKIVNILKQIEQK